MLRVNALENALEAVLEGALLPLAVAVPHRPVAALASTRLEKTIAVTVIATTATPATLAVIATAQGALILGMLERTWTQEHLTHIHVTGTVTAT